MTVTQWLTSRLMPSGLYRATLASFVCSIIALAFDLVSLGALSMWLVPAAALSTVLFHSILLALLHKDNKTRLPNTGIAPRYTSAGAYGWGIFLIILWGATLVPLIIIMSINFEGDDVETADEWLAIPIVEMLFILGELVALGFYIRLTADARRLTRSGSTEGWQTMPEP